MTQAITEERLVRTRLGAMDLALFAVGLGWNYLASVSGSGFFTAYTLGKMSGILVVALLVSFALGYFLSAAK